MKGKLTWDRDGTKRYSIDGREVTEAEWNEAFPPRPFDASNPNALCGWKRPILSDALAVHPNQVKAAMERDRKHGIDSEYTSDGRPILRDRGTRRKMLKSLGLHDNEGGYGDDHASSDHPGYGKPVDEKDMEKLAGELFDVG